MSTLPLFPPTLRLENGICATLGRTVLEIAPGVFAEGELVSAQDAPQSWTLYYKNGISVRHEVRSLPTGGVAVAATLCNESDSSLTLTAVHCHRATRYAFPRPLEKVYTNAEAMCGFVGFQNAPESFVSSGVCGFTDAGGELALVFGLGAFDTFLGEIEGRAEGADWMATVQCRFEGMELQPGQVVELPPLLIFTGNSLEKALGQYADAVGHAMKARPAAPAPTGWCSWYHYYGHETESDLLANLEEIAGSGLLTRPAVFQADDGWNLPYADHPRVWGDWFPGAKFPRGMKALADRIRERGFTPGLWLAPFSVDAASRLAQTHPEWMVQRRDEATGKLIPAGIGKNDKAHTLDLTQNAVLAFVRETFHRVFHEWGFDYVKIDFLVQALTPGIRADRRITPVQAFRRAMSVIREEAGDTRWILGCGCPLGPAIGICDSMRVGFDVGGGWDPVVTLPEWPNGNCCVKAAAIPAFYRHWMHGRWWQNDPDCIIVRDAPVEWEVAEAEALKKRLPIPPRPGKLCLSDEEAGCWVQLIWMLGDAAFASEVWSALPRSRQELLKRSFPPNPAPVRWVDWYEDPEVCLLHSKGDRNLVGVFNLSDTPRRVELPARKLGLERWRCTELWTGETFSGEGETVAFPEIAPHTGRIWEIAV